MKRPTCLILIAFTLTAATVIAHSGAAATSGASAKLISKSVRPNVGYSADFLTVPPGMLFMLTQACIEHPQAIVRVKNGPTVGDSGRLTYGARGCTTYRPAYVIAAGETLSCTNNSGLTRTCSVMGQMVENPNKPRSLMIDVDEALEAQAAKEKAAD